MNTKILSFIIVIFLVSSCSIKAVQPDYDLIIRDGLIYDGSGQPPVRGDIAVNKDKIIIVGKVKGTASKEIAANGLAVAPGFINMLSWATESLIEDGRSMGDIVQGVTLEVMGEGWSMGPVNERIKKAGIEAQTDIKYDIEWQTLNGYLEYLQHKGISTNVASFVGATTLRIHEVGFDDRPATEIELANMKKLLHQAMQEGALGLGSSLIYAPAFYASTEELIELNKVVAQYQGMYISHIRSEGNGLLEALDELITIAREANVAAEVYHLKMAGSDNWHKFDAVVDKIEAARKTGLDITTDMYLYTAGATGLDASMPPWVQEGGIKQWIQRLKRPEIRQKIIKEMKTNASDWENLYAAAGADGVLLSGFKTEKLKPLIGKTLAEVAKMRGTSPEETAMDLVIEDGHRVDVAYFLMTEENVKKQIALPWMSFGSDSASMEPKGVFLNSNPHPRAYGNFARLLGKYVREEKVIALTEAIRKLTSLPATNLKLKNRGLLAKGYYADIVIFDPSQITDKATFDKPHQLATGMSHVFVNGQQVLDNGTHTGAKPGVVVRGPGYKD